MPALVVHEERQDLRALLLPGGRGCNVGRKSLQVFGRNGPGKARLVSHRGAIFSKVSDLVHLLYKIDCVEYFWDLCLVSHKGAGRVYQRWAQPIALAREGAQRLERRIDSYRLAGAKL